MNWQEAEQLAECIRTETAGLIVVLGIEHLGPAGNPLYATEFFVKCACKRTGLQFAVKSLEHWEDLKEYVIIRICRWVYRFIKR